MSLLFLDSIPNHHNERINGDDENSIARAKQLRIVQTQKSCFSPANKHSFLSIPNDKSSLRKGNEIPKVRFHPFVERIFYATMIEPIEQTAVMRHSQPNCCKFALYEKRRRE
jgi:hypothetical protein